MVNGVHERAEGSVTTIVGVLDHIDQVGIGRDATSPLNVKIGFVHIARDQPGIAVRGHDDNLEVRSRDQARQSGKIAKGDQVVLLAVNTGRTGVVAVRGEIGLSDDRDGLTGAIQARRRSTSAGHAAGVRRQIVNRGEIAWH